MGKCYGFEIVGDLCPCIIPPLERMALWVEILHTWQICFLWSYNMCQIEREKNNNYNTSMDIKDKNL